MSRYAILYSIDTHKLTLVTLCLLFASLMKSLGSPFSYLHIFLDVSVSLLKLDVLFL